MVKNILRLANAVQALNLAGTNIKKAKKKKKNLKDIVELGTTNVVGTSMVRINANLIGSL